MEPNEYVKHKGWSCKERGDELILVICPICSDSKSHFYLKNSTGEWFCHKCQNKGNLWDLMKRMGDVDESIHRAFKSEQYKQVDDSLLKRYQQSILVDEEVISYLASRGINRESIKRFGLGVSKDANSPKWLCIPHYEGVKPVNIKFRSLPPAPKQFRRETGCRSILYNSDATKKHSEIIITEGEIDAITLIQNGFENVVGATNGCGAFDSDWIRQLEPAKKIWICFDNDEAGQNGALSLAKRLGYNRCWNVRLPKNDVNEFFQTRVSDDFKKQLKEASQFKLPGIIGVDDALDLLFKEQSKPKEDVLLTPWENVNRVVKGWSPGDIIIVTALPKTGKTTWCLDITRSLVLFGVPCLFYCLEMRPERLIRKMIQAQYRIENPTLIHIQNARGLFKDVPLYFGYSYNQKPDELINLLRDGIKRFDLKFVVFDNIHMLCRTDRVNEDLSRALLGFKQLAEEMEIPILLIAQPRKREGGSNEIISAEDVKHTSAFHSDCDQMIILHRKRVVSKAKEMSNPSFVVKSESMEPLTLVRVEAHRYGPGGETLLYYKGEHSRFEMTDLNIRLVSGKDRAANESNGA